ncbi:unnamed protein product [Soboliphyme baturini]|uniref:RRM domain-containing protein n=1 Tax=Soboliphyme baturini TaxID=241478 RepID=A0A183J759_9BILA|nr:unnamed protein product [Soboliphyme baturini]
MARTNRYIRKSLSVMRYVRVKNLPSWVTQENIFGYLVGMANGVFSVKMDKQLGVCFVECLNPSVADRVIQVLTGNICKKIPLINYALIKHSDEVKER